VYGSLEEAERIGRMSSISLFGRGSFSHFGSIFTDSGRFRTFSGLIFPLFVVFQSPRHGILARRR
jgi:hypothetical protein